MIASKVMTVPVRLLAGTAKMSAKAGYKTAKTTVVAAGKSISASAKIGYAAGRTVGYGRSAVFGTGVAVGVLIGSPRARAGLARVGSTVWVAVQRRKGPRDDEIAEQVRRRLAGSQATWNLAQPKVVVSNGQVRLDGEAPDVAGRRAIAEAASAVDGVREIDNRIVVMDVPGAGDNAAAGSTASAAAASASPGGNGASAAGVGRGASDPA